MTDLASWSPTQVAEWMESLELSDVPLKLKKISGKVLSGLDATKLQDIYKVSSKPTIDRLLKERDKLSAGKSSSQPSLGVAVDIRTFLIGTGTVKVERKEFRKLWTHSDSAGVLNQRLLQAVDDYLQKMKTEPEKGLLHYTWKFLVDPTGRVDAPKILEDILYRKTPNLMVTERDIFFHLSEIFDDDISSLYQEQNLTKFGKVVPLVYPQLSSGTAGKRQSFLLHQYKTFFSVEPRHIILSIRLDGVDGSSNLNKMLWSVDFLSGSQRGESHPGSADMVLLADNSVLVDMHGPVDENMHSFETLIGMASLVVVHVSRPFVVDTDDISTTKHKDTFDQIKKKGIPALLVIRDVAPESMDDLEEMAKGLFEGCENFVVKCLFDLRGGFPMSDFQSWATEFFLQYRSLKTESRPFTLIRLTDEKFLNLFRVDQQCEQQIMKTIVEEVERLVSFQGKKTSSEIRDAVQLCLPHLSSFKVKQKDASIHGDLQMGYKYLRKPKVKHRGKLSTLTRQFFGIVSMEPFSLHLYFFFVSWISTLSSPELATSQIDINVENFWRELVIAYCYGEKETTLTLSHLPKCFALCLDAGLPLEIFDGDNLHIHKKFLIEVGRELEKLKGMQAGELKFKVISVLGPQSSGKSTLMNIMYGLIFATRGGRCSRGIYCSVADIDDTSHIIMDTEGLLSTVERQGRASNYTGPLSAVGNSATSHQASLSVNPSEPFFLSGKKFDQTMILLSMCVSDCVIVNMKGEINSSINELIEMAVFGLGLLKLDTRNCKMYFVLRDMMTIEKNYQTESILMIIKTINGVVTGMNMSKLSVNASEKDFHLFTSAFIEMKKSYGGINSSQILVDSKFLASCSELRNNLAKSSHDSSYVSWNDWLERIDLAWDTISRNGDFRSLGSVAEYINRQKVAQIADALVSLFKERMKQRISEVEKSWLAGCEKYSLNFDNLSDEVRGEFMEKLPQETKQMMDENKISDTYFEDVSIKVLSRIPIIANEIRSYYEKCRDREKIVEDISKNYTEIYQKSLEEFRSGKEIDEKWFQERWEKLKNEALNIVSDHFQKIRSLSEYWISKSSNKCSCIYKQVLIDLNHASAEENLNSIWSSTELVFNMESLISNIKTISLPLSRVQSLPVVNKGSRSTTSSLPAFFDSCVGIEKTSLHCTGQILSEQPLSTSADVKITEDSELEPKSFHGIKKSEIAEKMYKSPKEALQDLLKFSSFADDVLTLVESEVENSLATIELCVYRFKVHDDHKSIYFHSAVEYYKRMLLEKLMAEEDKEKRSIDEKWSSLVEKSWNIFKSHKEGLTVHKIIDKISTDIDEAVKRFTRNLLMKDFEKKIHGWYDKDFNIAKDWSQLRTAARDKAFRDLKEKKNYEAECKGYLEFCGTRVRHKGTAISGHNAKDLRSKLVGESSSPIKTCYIEYFVDQKSYFEKFFLQEFHEHSRMVNEYFQNECEKKYKENRDQVIKYIEKCANKLTDIFKTNLSKRSGTTEFDSTTDDYIEERNRQRYNLGNILLHFICNVKLTAHQLEQIKSMGLEEALEIKFLDEPEGSVVKEIRKDPTLKVTCSHFIDRLEIDNASDYLRTIIDKVDKYKVDILLDEDKYKSTLHLAKETSRLQALGCIKSCPMCDALCDKERGHSGEHETSHHKFLSWKGVSYEWYRFRPAVVRRCDSKYNMEKSRWTEDGTKTPWSVFGRSQIIEKTLSFKEYTEIKCKGWKYEVCLNATEFENEQIAWEKWGDEVCKIKGIIYVRGEGWVLLQPLANPLLATGIRSQSSSPKTDGN